MKLACEANNPDLEFVKFWTPKSNKFLIGIASKPLVDRREVQALITHTVIIFNGIRELIPQKAGFGFSLVRFFVSRQRNEHSDVIHPDRLPTGRQAALRLSVCRQSRTMIEKIF